MTDSRILEQADAALASGRAAAARELLLDALRTRPGEPRILHGLARASAALGDVDGTIGWLTQLSRRAPRPLQVLDELARYCLANGRVEAAVEAYRRHLAAHPDDARAHFNCAWYATRLARHEVAVEHYGRALALGIERPAEVHLNIARICSDGLRDDARARRHLEQALALDPEYGSAWYNLGNLAEQQGLREEARRAFARCLELEPRNDAALARLADTHDFQGDQSGELFERLAEAARRSADADLHFALGRALEQRGDDVAAWREYSEANAADRREFPPYDPAQSERRFDRIIATCTRDWLGRLQTDQPRAPVFICGMFRSGSTLVEQVLAAHPAFTPAGEREFLPRLVASALPQYPDGLEALRRRQVDAWARGYAAESDRIFGRHARLTDKRPDNFLWLGLVKAMFPKAKLVVTLRDRRDVAASVFTTRLGPAANYSTDLGHIRHFLGQHDRLLRHWSGLFGDDLVTVRYEALVADPRAEAGRLLEALGEPWDERCLAFHELGNTVRTASVWQVRRPLYGGSVQRWQKFREAFDAAFGAEAAESATPQD